MRRNARRERPLNVEVTDIGAWGRATLVAEYDPECNTIRVNARAVEHVRAALGDAETERFVAYAVAHERFHYEHPLASEAAAHDHARARCDLDPARFEAVLRAQSG